MDVIGTQIGNYKIVSAIGQGAMGYVFAAEHATMGRRAAVKLIREEHGKNSEISARFVNEARAINAIGHPNIVEVTDVGLAGDRRYLVMELLEGETLEERLVRLHRLPPEHALHIALQVSDALAAAHDLGIVHRDLKPDNVFLIERGGREDYVKVLDFGIAKLIQEETAPQAANLTTPGMVVGTPQYMSPEQCMADEALDHRSDIYSLGIVLYRMLTGVLPFGLRPTEHAMRYLFAHVNKPPTPLRTVVPEITEHLEEAVLRAIAKDPADRYQSMRAFATALASESEVPSVALFEAALAAPSHLDAEDAASVAPEAGAASSAATRLARVVLNSIHSGRLALPSMPGAVLQCLSLLRQPTHTVKELAEVLERDPIVAPQVLSQANSALFAGTARMRNIEQAIGRLGERALNSLLVEVSARRLFESRNLAIRRAFRELWDHSVAVGIVARSLAQVRGHKDIQLAYLAGLLHDIGKPVTAAVLLEAERVSGRPAKAWHSKEAWLDMVSQCHREVGFAVARAWQLPDEVLFAIARSDRYSLQDELSPVNLVCLANALVKREGIYPQPVSLEAVDAIIEEGKRLFQLDDAMLERAMAQLRAHTMHQATVVAESSR